MKIGFIGTGNMGHALIKAIRSSDEKKDILIFDIDKQKCENLIKNYNVKSLNSEIEIAQNSDIIVLAVKPNIYPSVLEKIKNHINKESIILTIAAGFSIAQVENIIGANQKIVRTMPNTPAQVLEGMTAVTYNSNITKENKQDIETILSSIGVYQEINEELMHVFAGISGSLPAYIYLFIEAVGDAAVLEGFSRGEAYKIISQAVLGSAKMVLETGKHPAQLKDEVTSPKGTTIEAIKALEKGNFRNTIMNAVIKCTNKSKKMGESNN